MPNSLVNTFGTSELMKQAKFVAFEQIVIMSLMKNLLWNVSHGSIEILFCKNCGQSNVFSLYWIQFLSKRTKKVKLRNYTHIYTHLSSEQPIVRFGRTSAELSDKELPKIRFGWFPTMHKFGLPIRDDKFFGLPNSMKECIPRRHILLLFSIWKKIRFIYSDFDLKCWFGDFFTCFSSQGKIPRNKFSCQN